eukprot:CAMPEP_0113617800 /NCGR_PEP_ID=MMETSP0017_2-20120614/8985_1 /TAXON_ID=2856 /ORGANISM="Cylindrotheca closterium" /LENGTH=216 /DNA_ID=CAMNT_0000527243 /DNA_START=171 /DNA_END=821 /DNA_ORIENTATION=+ /assembly_acc=CAM_ASM_000147
MALRISSTTSTTTPSAFRPFFDRLVEDGRITMGQKTDAVKTLQLVLKNAITDPVKSQDPKYRQLKLGNAKLQRKLFSIPVVMEILQKVGFQQQTVDGEESLVLPAQNTPNTMGQDCVEELVVTQQRLAIIAGDSTSANVKAAVPEKLSEKQKARMLMEEKEKQEKLKAKENRKRNLALLKEDKHVRENDPNWKPKVSAACAKTGTGIETFRDKYGE